jgi:hypothetical protein
LSERNSNTPNTFIDFDTIDPCFQNLLENFFFLKTPLTTDSSCLITSNSTDYIEDFLDLEIQAQKYYRISANIKITNKSANKPPKKGKVSGVSVIGRLIDGLIAIASSISMPIETITIIQNNTFSFIIKGQAVAKVKKKIYLTKNNIILIADLLSNARLARTYIALKSNKIYKGWLKTQIVRELNLVNSFLNNYFIKPKIKVKALPKNKDKE